MADAVGKKRKGKKRKGKKRKGQRPCCLLTRLMQGQYTQGAVV